MLFLPSKPLIIILSLVSVTRGNAELAMIDSTTNNFNKLTITKSVTGTNTGLIKFNRERVVHWRFKLRGATDKYGSYSTMTTHEVLCLIVRINSKKHQLVWPLV